MKKTVLKLALLLSAAPLLVSCASQTDVDALQRQLRIVNKKIEDMRSDTVDRLEKRQAAAFGQMDQLEQDIVQLKNQLEESYYLNQRLREQNKELEQTISSIAANEATQREEALRRLEEQQREKEALLKEELEQKLRLQEESVRKIQEARIKEAERRAKEAAIEAELAKKRSTSVKTSSTSGSVQHIKTSQAKKKYSVVAPPVVPTDAKIAPPSVTPETRTVAKTTPKVVSPQIAPVTSAGDDYSKAEELFTRKKYSEAFKIFEQIAVTSQGSQGVDARYMAGESLFAQKEYDKAIMQYQQIIAKHASHAKAPAAMLKQAMAFEKLADKDTAKVIYKKVLKKHGDSSEAATAQEHLDRL